MSWFKRRPIPVQVSVSNLDIIKLSAGDCLLVTLPDYVTHEQAQRVAELFKERFDGKVIVISDDIKVTALESAP